MWRSISHSDSGFRLKKRIADLGRVCHNFSDDETSSKASTEEGRECPICWESFNIVENVPYVLWCGHTLCKSCVLGLESRFPFLFPCPWCNLLTFRLFYKSNLRFPIKNFFLLWMVESRNGDRVKSLTSICRDREQEWSPSSCNNDSSTSERLQMSFHKSLDIFCIRITVKFPLVILLLIVIFALPTSAAILMLYLVITILFAVPAFLVL
ncbi:hypothetical protein Pfo_009551 [Paulownia fortunei]|nr:hypothetical protein Pfo_009551 [Paulownia fortunei]